jgi:hypothetical protein
VNRTANVFAAAAGLVGLVLLVFGIVLNNGVLLGLGIVGVVDCVAVVVVNIWNTKHDHVLDPHRDRHSGS